MIPVDIYLVIFDYISPSRGRPDDEEIKILAKMAAVCRLFGQIALPRIFEYAHFSGAMMESKSSAHLNRLCRSIVAGEKLAQVIALCVEVCHFTDFEMKDTFLWGMSMFSELYASGMAYMKNIHQLKFLHSFVRKEHWEAIMNMEALEEVVFDACEFYEGPSPSRGGQVPQFRVSRLEVLRCLGIDYVVPAVDSRSLRFLKTDIDFARRIIWHRESILEELYIEGERMVDRSAAELPVLPPTLAQIPPSVIVLSLRIPGKDEEIKSLSRLCVWDIVPGLREFKLEVVREKHEPDISAYTVIASIRGCWRHEGLQSFVLHYVGNNGRPPETERVKTLIRDTFSNAFPNINFVDIYGTALRLVGRKWVHVSSSDEYVNVNHVMI
ncbi:hypothetical protein F5I97DRAFT_1870198, partial [Phlebopus sp. FC_14]